jgi:formylglycine-generating enzyme required for sulfatase activity
VANGYRLPTEAEWEKAARGGVANRRFPWDGANTIQHARANYKADPSTYTYDTSPTTSYHPSYNTGGYPYTSPVGSFAPNGYGLYDMAGNVWEWCWDRYQDNYYGSSPGSDPRGPSSGSWRVMRGGVWDSIYTYYVRCAYRRDVNPVNETDDIGFRCARGL